jgi:carboxymethylenebutenolidase
MMDPTTRQRAILLYDRFTHERMERRAFMAEMVKIAGSVAAAQLLIAGIAASPAAAAIVPENDARLRMRTFDMPLKNGRRMTAYAATRLAKSRGTPVLVIHENRGLNAHIKDVTRRLALAGFPAVAPDFLSSAGGTPTDEDKARELIGVMDLAQAVGDAVQLLATLGMTPEGPRKVGAIGFCWGGGFVNRLAVAAGDRLDAGVAYYGPAPDPSEAPKVEAALELHDAGLDERVNVTSFPWVNALRTAGKTVKFFLYEGVNHAFNNDTSAERYNKAAADLAWKRTLAFFGKYLA